MNVQTLQNLNSYRNLERGFLIHFSPLKSVRELDIELDIGILRNALMKMKNSIEGHFQDFRVEKAILSSVINHFDADRASLNFPAFTGVNQAELELESADLQE